MDSVSALSWSKKWHIVDLNMRQKPGGKYWISRCGVHVARDTDIPYPEHLKNVKRGFSKSTGFCKKCYKSAGVKTATVELPEPDRRVAKSEYCNAYSVWNHQLFGDEVVVFDNGTFEMFRKHYSDTSLLRSAAAVLLAAAEMSDRARSK